MKVVRASAGTGKTTMLVREYLELLAAGHPPHRLAAVTYTRRAAAELKARIYRALRERQVEGGTFPPSLEEQAEELAARVLEAPLDTIHGFSELLLRLAAPLLGLDPGLVVGDPGRLEGWFLEAARGQAQVRGYPLDEETERALLDLFKGQVLAETFQPVGERSAALLKLFEDAFAVYRARVRHVIHPGDAERLAVKLAQNPRARSRIVERLRAVLVDEYQDTNPMQQALFEGLAEAGVDVRVVGDPKQSIFAFRNAVPEGFVEAADRHGAAVLSDSFRHPPAMAEFLNTYVEAMHKGGRKGFEHPDPVAGRRAGKPKIQIFEIRRGKDLDMAAARRVEARLAAGIVHRWLADKIPPREIMVLVERRYYAQPLLEELSALGIPYAVQGGTDLFRLNEVQELIHLLHYAAAGFDGKRENLAALLTGPFVGLSLAEAQEVIAHPAPAEVLAERYPEANERLKEIEKTFADHPAGPALAQVVESFRFLETLEEQVADSVLYALARVARIDDPAEAAATLESLRAHGEEGRLATGDGETVWITTVHSAKGLQSEAVLVFDAGRAFDPKKPGVLIVPGSGEVALEGEKGYDDLWGDARKRAEHEWLRLLYVALSRAKSRLVVTGSENQKRGAQTWLGVLKGIFGGSNLYRELSPQQADKLRKMALAAAVPSPKPPYRAEPVPAPESFPPALQSPSKAEAEHRLPEPDPEAEALEAERRVRAQIVGTLVHAGIERDWKLEALDEALAGERIFAELPGEERTLVRDEVARFLGKYRELLERGLIPPLDAREVDLKEIPAAFTLGGQAWYGVIDRLYKAGGVWYLEDYKTDREPNPNDHLLQLALYREVVRRARGVDPKVRLVYLATGEVVPIAPEALDEALAQAQS